MKGNYSPITPNGDPKRGTLDLRYFDIRKYSIF